MANNSIRISSLFVTGAAALSFVGCMTNDVDDELGSAEQAVSAGKRTICHYNGQGVPHEITISENAVPAHFANHGDHDLLSFYADNDGDGYGAGAAIRSCTPPGGTSTNADDCNDGDASVNPAAAEVCDDGIDNNCDGTAPASDTYYADSDGDGYGAGPAILVCEAPQPPDTSTNADDCNDADGSINPGAAEVCGDNTDNNCDGAFAISPPAKILNFQPQVFDGSNGVCTIHGVGQVTICRERPGQVIRLAGNAAGTVGAYFDELGVTRVTGPDGIPQGRNYIFFQAQCRNAAYGNTNFPGSPSLIDATSLFGNQVGQFTVHIDVPNAFQPYSHNETWVVPVN